MAILIFSADTSLFLGSSLSSLSFKEESNLLMLLKFKPYGSVIVCASESSDSLCSLSSSKSHKDLCCVFLIVDSISAREGTLVL